MIQNEKLLFGNNSEIHHIHMLGINGISMSGLAELLIERGYRISGSDLSVSKRTERLRGMGAQIFSGNHRDNIQNPDLVVYTAAIQPDNPEFVCAQERRIPLMERAVLLGLIMAAYKNSVAICGTHGKTTTTSMLTEILIHANMAPTIHIGAEYAPINGGTMIGSSDIFLAEACEYKDSFLKFHPSTAVILNVDFDHADYFHDLDQVKSSFLSFSKQAAHSIIANGDDPNVRSIYETFPQSEKQKWLLFSVKSNDAAFAAKNISFNDQDCASFDLHPPSAYSISPFRLDLQVPGRHNLYNALAAASAALLLGCSIDAVHSGLRNFGGAKKRFELKGTFNDITVIDDYAHHPTEIKPTLLTAFHRAKGAKVWCVFQPHTYSRTKSFLEDFAAAFQHVHKVILPDIYAAREADPGDISSKILADEINKKSRNAIYIKDGFQAIADYILENANPGDIVITMGAGEAVKVADILLKPIDK